MSDFRLDRFLELLASPMLVWGTVAGGFALLGIALVVLMMTRLGQTHPLGKSVILSVFTHVLLAFWMSSMQFAAATLGHADGEVDVGVVGSDEPFAATTAAHIPRPAQPWDRFTTEPIPDSSPALAVGRPQFDLPPDPKRQTIAEFAQVLGEANVTDLPTESARPPLPARIAAESPTKVSIASPAESIEVPSAQRQESPAVKLAAPPAAPARPSGEPPAGPAERPGSPSVSSSLLNQSISVPRLNDPSITPEPSAFPIASGANPREARPAPREDLPGVVDLKRPGELATSRTGGAGETSRGTGAGVDGLLRRDAPENSAVDPLASAAPTISPQITTLRRDNVEHEVPEIYKLRVAPDRARLARQHGGTQETEAAVNAALHWMATNQSADGRWDASLHGAGREDKVLGHDRKGAGAKADTGMSGLALLAFLGAGHTHRDGQFQDTVARGLDFLIRSQGSDGNLAGEAELYAAMYCHGMAAIALSEAYALTDDKRLERPLRRAISYTLASQHADGRWLALSPRRSTGRHQPARLAAHGTAERQAGGHRDPQAIRRGHDPFPAQRGSRPPRRTGELPRRRASQSHDDRRGHGLPAFPGPACR